jgi:hypothetical protein
MSAILIQSVCTSIRYTRKCGLAVQGEQPNGTLLVLNKVENRQYRLRTLSFSIPPYLVPPLAQILRSIESN